MSENIIELEFGKRLPPADPVVVDSLELLRIFQRAIDPDQRRMIIRLIDYMLPEDDPALWDNVFPP